MSKNLPASTLRLGALRKEYKASAKALRTVVFIMLGCAVVVGLFFWGAVSSAQQHDWGSAVGLSLPGLLFSVPVGFAVYALFRGRGARLRLYENGLTFRRGGTESATTWGEVESYILGTAARIVTEGGEVIELGGGIEGVDEVAQAIQDETLKLMLPQVRALVDGGANVEFKGWKPGGKVLSNLMGASSGFTVNASGITEKDSGARILWSAVTGFELSDETMGSNRVQLPVRVFRIADQSQAFASRADLLANAHVLLALCAERVNPSG